MGKRLFIGIKVYPSPEVLGIVKRLKEKFVTSDIHWVNPNNFHITLMFLGNVSLDQIPLIVENLHLISNQYAPFEMYIKGLGRFSMKHKTNVIWFGLDNTKVLTKMARDVANCMVELGFFDDKRSYNPHLTIARVKSICDEEVLSDFIELLNGKIIQHINVNEIILFESIQKPSGVIYYAISTFRLGLNLIK